MFYNCQKGLVLVLLLLVIFLFSAFSDISIRANVSWAENFVKSCFDATAGKQKLKKWELVITDNGFFRFKKFYVNGKQEYFSFNLKKFDDFDYLGTEEVGEIVLRTKEDDIIVQTYNDPKGNIDSMARELRIPVLNVQAEMLDSLRTNMLDYTRN
ncbi:hypothetical protein [Desertivirga brevis]|uniref:hypothetical protein n=1 Tax=Desertivirga brevis TaxID=2810310 RepID=UPI001A9682FD|nr:hypothetical protein [Pedobacter sp. SYSU D00873]